MNLAKVRVGDVGVNLGGGDVGVAEHGLDRAEVGAVHEEVSGKRVAESVRGDVFGDAGGFGVVINDALDGAGGEAAEISGSVDGVEIVGVVEKECGEGVASNGEVISGGAGGGFTDEDGAVFFALAADDEFATVEVDRVAIKITEFGDAEAAREEKFDDGAVAKAGFGVGRDSV